MIKIHSTSMSVRVVNCDSSDTIIDAWKTSRPNAEINKDTLNEILKMDLPVNEMVHLTLDCRVPVIVREIITTLREHIMWARTSRVDNLLESWDIYDRALQDEDVKDIIEYKATQVENLSKETSQDNYRKYLPLAYMTEFTFKVSLRTLGKLINHMQWISKNYPSLVNICYDFTMALYAGLYQYYENMISGVSSELPKDYQAYREYFNNALDSPKHINYNEYHKFETDSIIYDDNFMRINIKDIPIGLRAQLVRSRTMMIADNLLDAFEENGWKSDNTMTVNMSICSSKQFFLNMCSQRECWLAQRDLWSPILDLIHLHLEDEVILPCRSGKCPVYQDCIQRLIGKDPGVVCPMNYILHKDETIPMKVLDDKEIQKIQEYAIETKRCNSLVKASNSLKEVITKFKGE